MDTISGRVRDFDPQIYTSYELVDLALKIDEELMNREAESDEAARQGLDEYDEY